MSMSELPLELMDYEPKPQDRVWYESILSGEKGYLFKKEGRTYVNRGEGTQPLLFRNNEWQPVKPHRPIMQYHVGRIAFMADRGFLHAIGELAKARVGWDDISQEERMRWVHGVGPGKKSEEGRQLLYRAILSVMKEYVE
jgi:hypothetical protein